MRERFGGSSAMKLISKLDEEEEDEFPQTEINVNDLSASELSTSDVARIEKKLDNYYLDKLKTVQLSTDEDIESYFARLNQD